MEVIYLIITGFFVGLMSSFFGIGGGGLMIPVLYFLFPHLPAQAIIPSSLGVIFLNSLINNYHFYKQELTPKKKTIINIGISATVGAFIGSLLVHQIETQLLKNVFSVILIIVASKTLFSKGLNESNQLNEVTDNTFKIALTAFLGSLLSSLTGLGGGIIFVPMFLSYIKLPLIKISPYSNITMSFATLVGVLPHFFYPLELNSTAIETSNFIGHVNLYFIGLLFLGAFVSSKLGTKLNSKVNFQTKKYLLTILLLSFAIKTLI